MFFVQTCNPMCGKTFRDSLKRPSPILKTTENREITRVVPAFTVQSLQKNTSVRPPPVTGVFRPTSYKPTRFRDAYLRQELPIFIEFSQSGRRVGWKIPVELLDLTYYMPIFVTGLSERAIPFDYLVEQGLKDIFTKAGHRVLACLPFIVLPLQEAMRTKIPRAVVNTMRCLQSMCKLCSNVGPALVPYYRHFLPQANLLLLKGRRKPCEGDHLKMILPAEDVIYMIEDTLQVLELYGGPDAYLNIKYHIPVYESFVKNTS